MFSLHLDESVTGCALYFSVCFEWPWEEKFLTRCRSTARFHSAFTSGMSFIGRLLDGFEDYLLWFSISIWGKWTICDYRIHRFSPPPLFFCHKIICRSIRFQPVNVFCVCHFECAKRFHRKTSWLRPGVAKHFEEKWH